MAFIVSMIGYWLPKGIEYACAVVVMGISIGEVACFLFSFWGYIQAKNKGKQREKATITGVTSKIGKIIIPLSITAYIRSALRLAEDVLILAGLKTFSGNDSAATGVYGMLKGMVMPLLVFPLSLLSSFVITLTPEISRMNAAGNSKRLESTISRILSYTFIAGILIVVVFMTFPTQLGVAIYKDAAVGDMLRQLSFLCPFMCVEMVVVDILNGMGQQVASMRYALADSVVRIAMIYFLIPINGVKGFMAMMVVSNIMTSVFNLVRLIRVTKIKFRFNEWVIKPVLAAAASSQIVAAVMNYGLLDAFSPRFALVMGIAIVCAVYILMLLSVGSVRLRDFTWIVNRLRTSSKTPKAAPESAV
jgi:stage V sporulation protein B